MSTAGVMRTVPASERDAFFEALDAAARGGPAPPFVVRQIAPGVYLWCVNGLTQTVQVEFPIVAQPFVAKRPAR